ncbi:MAG: hypothetical protein O9286_10085 [Aquidulcibacter sp.]|uniref:DUF6883 domain-containing protein n=1 Tax=Aquidulcibacter sp. TaxID=2052990 RepID=UPI0022C1CC11|nr:hypothetical protein [Aquidulcibacter sp.]
MQPFGDNVSISEAKLTEYVLSPSHRIGANKARVFKSALRIGLAEVAVLRSALLDAARKQTPNFIRQDKFGRHYAIVFKLTYGTKSAFVRSLWVIRTGDDVAKFVSAFVVTDKRAGSEDKKHD